MDYSPSRDEESKPSAHSSSLPEVFSRARIQGSGLIDDKLLTLSTVSAFRPHCLRHYFPSAVFRPSLHYTCPSSKGKLSRCPWGMGDLSLSWLLQTQVKEIVLWFWSRHLTGPLSLSFPICNMDLLNPWGRGGGTRVGKKEQKMREGKAKAFFWKQGPVWKRWPCFWGCMHVLTLEKFPMQENWWMPVV